MAIISSRPQIALVKTRWRKKGPRTLEERASVIGANVWKIALEVFKHMEKEGFRFGSDRLTTEVITEFIAFLVPLVDREVYGRLADADRATLVSGVVRHLAATMENNQLDLFGPGEYRKPFIDALNAHNGDVEQTCADLASNGFAIDETEVKKIRENHWFPYFAYRLLAKHGPDGKLVAQELTELGVEFDRFALRDLVRSWRA